VQHHAREITPTTTSVPARATHRRREIRAISAIPFAGLSNARIEPHGASRKSCMLKSRYPVLAALSLCWGCSDNLGANDNVSENASTSTTTTGSPGANVTGAGGSAMVGATSGGALSATATTSSSSGAVTSGIGTGTAAGLG